MNLNLNGITFPLRETSGTPGSNHVTIRFCTDCEEPREEQTNSRFCEVCGSDLSIVQRQFSAEESRAEDAHRTVWDSLIDFLGEDFRDEIEAAISTQNPNRSISESYLATLGRLQVDENSSILFDSFLTLGETCPFHCLLVPASFRKVDSPSVMQKRVVKGQPEYGEREFDNKEFCKDRIVMLSRGRVSFAAKAKVAMQAQAAALIIVQTSDIWPYSMTDSSNEFEQYLSSVGDLDAFPIPIYMMSKADAAIFEKLYFQAPADDKNLPRIVVQDKVNSCSICYEKFELGETTIKLNCRHLYHEDCVRTWLQTHSTCPLCREKMPESKETTARSTRTNTGASTQRQPYAL